MQSKADELDFMTMMCGEGAQGDKYELERKGTAYSTLNQNLKCCLDLI